MIELTGHGAITRNYLDSLPEGSELLLYKPKIIEAIEQAESVNSQEPESNKQNG